MTRRPGFGERAYRRLLKLLPAGFRGDFADDMARDVADRARGARSAPGVWLRELPALVWTVLVQHADDAWRDAGLALRMMRRAPWFAAAAILMLAAGTGANIAMFSVIDAVLLRSALPDAGRVVDIGEQLPGAIRQFGIPAEQFETIASAPEFDGVSARAVAGPVWSDATVPQRVSAECVSASYFHITGVAPLLGRTFTADEDHGTGSPVVVLSYRLWQQGWSGDPHVLGRTMTIAGVPYTVIGVMPHGYLGAHVNNRASIWVPFGPGLAGMPAAGCRFGAALNLVARLRAPLTLEQAQEQMERRGLLAPVTPGAVVFLQRSDALPFDGVRDPLLALVGVVACVLLIACANVANLQLERAVGRRRELAVRLALGATRVRLVRQTLVENLMLSMTGAAIGVLLAAVTLSSLVAMMSPYVPHVADISIDWRALVAAIAMAVIAGAAVGLITAWQAMNADVGRDLTASSRSATGGRRWIRQALVTGEVALSVILLIGAVLMVRTFLHLRPTDAGFDAADRTVVEMTLPPETRPGQHRDFVAVTSSRLVEVAGVDRVTASTYLPLSGLATFGSVRAGASKTNAWTSSVTASYFASMAIPVMRGREFTLQDAGGAPVVVINDTLAGRLWKGRDAVGQVVAVTDGHGATTSRQIVGVVGNTRSLAWDLRPRAEVYVPYAQDSSSGGLYLILRTQRPAPVTLERDVRAAIAAVAPGQIVDDVTPLAVRVADETSTPRFGAWLFGLFATIAVSLAALGLGTVIAQWVAQRRREIGVRLALGAGGAAVARLILRQGLVLAGAGTLLGLGGAKLATKLIADSLYGVTPTDKPTYAAAAIAMITIAALASYLPASRAAAIDPVITLRED